MTIPATLLVVLPNYNHAKFIGRALAALLAQARAADEIIVIDDGSTDDSMRVIERFAAKAPSINVLVNPSNRGVIPTLQRGLQAARGKYLYFAAADDFVLPGFLNRRCAGSRPMLIWDFSAAKRCWSMGATTGRSPSDRRCGR